MWNTTRAGLVIASGLAVEGAEVQSAPFEALHFERTRSLQLDGTPEEVFPLFEPEGRQQWASGWDPEFLYSQSGEVQAGTVLRTSVHGDEWAIWVVADHDPRAKSIRYVIFLPDTEAWELEIRCVPGPQGGTVASVTYRVTALTEEANDPVREFFAEHFEPAMDSWQSAINTVLRGRRGER